MKGKKIKTIILFFMIESRCLISFMRLCMDSFNMQISSRNLDRVRKLKSAMTRLTARVQKVWVMCGVQTFCMWTIKSVLSVLDCVPNHEYLQRYRSFMGIDEFEFNQHRIYILGRLC